jgi:hypothetical protein
MNHQDEDPRKRDQGVLELLVEKRRMLESYFAGHGPTNPHRSPFALETVNQPSQILDSASWRLKPRRSRGRAVLAHANDELFGKGLECPHELCRVLIIEQPASHRLQKRPRKLKSGSDALAVDGQHERCFRFMRSGSAPQKEHPIHPGTTYEENAEVDPRPTKPLGHCPRPDGHAPPQIVARGLRSFTKILGTERKRSAAAFWSAGGVGRAGHR